MSCPCTAVLKDIPRYIIHIPAKITGSNPIVVQIVVAIDNADEDTQAVT